MKLVFLLLDACKSSYIESGSMPFTEKLGLYNQYIKTIIPSPGFCERSEIFTGLDCFESGNFTAIGYQPSKSEYSKSNSFLCFASLVSKIYKRGAKYLVQKYRIKNGISMKPYYIPPLELHNYNLTEDSEQHFVKYDTLFDKLDEIGLRYTLEGFTSLADMVENKVDNYVEFVDRMTDFGVDFIPVYVGITDNIGHRYGNDMDSIAPYLKELDKTIKSIYEVSHNKGYELVILGDHGMIPVAKTVDINREIKKAGLGKKSLIFLDSTLARFWTDDEESYTLIRKILQNKFGEDGFIIDKDNYWEYNVPLDILNSERKPVYGDFIWCAHPGVLILPDFFNNPRLVDKGMHGYIETDMKEGVGFLISTKPSMYVESLRLKDVCGILCNILECDKPNQNWRRQLCIK